MADISKTIEKYLDMPVDSVSIHKKKKFYIEVAENFKNKIGKYYKIPSSKMIKEIVITSKLNYRGLCDTDEGKIYIKTGDMDTDTLYHELAHWIQGVKYGETACDDMRKKDNHELIQQHHKIQSEIASLAKKWGIDKDIRNIMIM